jgi:hypothetical protein
VLKQVQPLHQDVPAPEVIPMPVTPAPVATQQAVLELSVGTRDVLDALSTFVAYAGGPAFKRREGGAVEHFSMSPVAGQAMHRRWMKRLRPIPGVGGPLRRALGCLPQLPQNMTIALPPPPKVSRILSTSLSLDALVARYTEYLLDRKYAPS